MLRTIIVDDEPPARRAMAGLIARHADLTLVGQAGSAAEATALLRKARPDVAFLDIELGRASGFSLTTGGDAAPYIVIVTAHALHAPTAFDVAAVDFLLKPVLPGRFAQTVRRLTRLQAAAPAAPLKVSRGRSRQLLEPARIVALQAERDFTRLRLADAPALLLSRSLGSLEAELPNPPFVRLSRSLMLNLHRIDHCETIDRQQTRLVMTGGTVLTLGRTAGTALKRHWRTG